MIPPKEEVNEEFHVNSSSSGTRCWKEMRKALGH
jgi:hypothetical protein